MNVRHFGLAAVVSIAGIVACSSDETTPAGASSSGGSSSGGSSSGSTSSSGGSSSGSTSSSGSAGDECKIAPGTYTVKNTRTKGDAAKCPETNTDIEIKESSGDGGTPTPQPGCTVDNNTATCTSTVDCKTTAGDYTTTIKSVTTSKGGTISGTSANKTVKDDDGSVLSECEYTFTWTKK